MCNLFVLNIIVHVHINLQSYKKKFEYKNKNIMPLFIVYCVFFCIFANRCELY